MFDEQPDGDIHGECAIEIRRLERELAEARKDAERLNWIFKHGCGVRRKYNARQNLVCWSVDGRPYIDRKMREEAEQRAAAIDAARVSAPTE